MIKVLLLKTNILLISQIEEVSSELGEPDCKLVKPFVITDVGLIPWLSDFTTQIEMMIHSDSLLTIVDPNETYLDKYQSLISK
jgi:hypothetical protein